MATWIQEQGWTHKAAASLDASSTVFWDSHMTYGMPIKKKYRPESPFSNVNLRAQRFSCHKTGNYVFQCPKSSKIGSIVRHIMGKHLEFNNRIQFIICQQTDMSNFFKRKERSSVSKADTILSYKREADLNPVGGLHSKKEFKWEGF